MKGAFTIIICLSCYSLIFAQTEIFHDLMLKKTITNNEKCKTEASLTWKHIYDEIGWRRWGGTFSATRKLNVFSIKGGLLANYTFDKGIVNYWEISPWIGVGLTNEVFKKLQLVQLLRGEFRSFLFADNVSNFNFRTRYKIGLEYPLLQKNDVDDWVLTTDFEWYLVRNKELNERYVNSTEYSLLISKRIQQKFTSTFGIRLEDYNNNFINQEEKVITFVLMISL